MNSRSVILLVLVAGCAKDSPARPSVDAATLVDAGATDLPGLSLGSDLYLDQLDAAAWQTLCQWTVDVQGGPHTVDCGNGVGVTIDPVADCVSQADRPHCTVGVYRACLEAQARDLCANAPAECTAFYQCAGGP